MKHMGNKWSSFIDKSDFEKGYPYFLEHKVTSLTVNEDCIRAEVEGSSLYHVLIKKKDGEIVSCHCTCPRFEETGSCKHLAAVALSLTEKEEGEKEGQEETDIKKLLEASSSFSIKEFLLKETERDKSLRHRLFLALAPEKESNKRIEITSSDLEGILASYQVDDRFLEYDDYDRLENEVNEWFAREVDPLLQKVDHVSLGSFLVNLLPKFDSIETDSDDSGSLFNETLSHIQNLIPLCSSTEEERLFDMLVFIRDKVGTDYLLDDVDDTLCSSFPKELTPKKVLPFMDQLIIKAQEDEYGDYRLKELVLAKWALMDEDEEAKGADFIAPYLSNQRIFEGYAKALIDKGRYSKATSLLNETHKRSGKKESPVSEKTLLLECYKRSKETDKEKLLLRELIDMNCQDNEANVKLLKELDSQEEWLLDRETVIKNRFIDMASFFDEEGLKGSLLEEVEVHPFLTTIKDHFASLYEQDPIKTNELFFSSLSVLSEKSTYHHGYEEIIAYLRFYARSIKDGWKGSLAFAKEEVLTYERRRKYVALLEAFILECEKKAK